MFYFLHISKCAGSSFVELARRNVPLFAPEQTGNPLNPISGERITYWLWNTAEQAYFLSSPHWRFVANEKQLGRDAFFLDGVTYVVVLRDPLDRLFSLYQFKFGKPEKSLSLEERGRMFARFLKEEGPAWWQNSLIAWLTYRGARGAIGGRLELAKLRLEQFDDVLLMDTLATDVSAFVNKHGWHRADIPWKNAGTPGEQQWSAARHALAPYPELLDQVLQANAADLELYSYAREVARRRASAPPVLERIPPASQRIMPESSNFEFLIICAYEGFLSGDRDRAREILFRAAEMRRSEEPSSGDERFVDDALLRFSNPKKAYKELRAIKKQKWQSRREATRSDS